MEDVTLTLAPTPFLTLIPASGCGQLGPEGASEEDSGAPREIHPDYFNGEGLLHVTCGGDFTVVTSQRYKLYYKI